MSGELSEAEYDRMCLAVLCAEEMLKAANARIAELESAQNADLAAVARLMEQRDAANARADEAERARGAECAAAHSDVTRLEAEVAALRAEVERVKWLARATAEAADSLRGKLADARAEVERLRDEGDETRQERNDAGSSLAEARQLLEDVVEIHGYDINVAGISSWLAANPESPRALTAVERGKAVERMFEEEPQCTNTEAFLSGLNDGCDGTGCPVHSPRAAAERAVLDACRDSEIVTDYRGRPRIRGIDQVLVAKAELALRAVKP